MLILEATFIKKKAWNNNPHNFKQIYKPWDAYKGSDCQHDANGIE